MNGPGTFTFSDGRNYIFEQQDNEKTGLTIMIYNNYIYEGEIVKGKREGYGKLFSTYQNGDVYEGNWSNDKRHG